jgi:hypothetical protein
MVMSAEINRVLISQTFQALNDYSQGRVTTPAPIAQAAEREPNHYYLTGGRLLTFDETRARGDYHVILAAPDGPQIITGRLGGIAVGDKLFFPQDMPPRGAKPLMLIRLVCPEPSYNLDITSIDCPPAMHSQGMDQTPAFLALTEHAVAIPGVAEEDQPLQTATQYMLRVWASQDKIYCPPHIPLLPTI